jgi:hypothetical protein
LILLVFSGFVLVWSILLVMNPGGSKPLEWLQIVSSVLIGGYGLFAYRKNHPVYSRRCRFILLSLAVIGVVMVLGLAADQRSSRTWARLGWVTLILGFAGTMITWWRLPEHRATTIVMTVLGSFLIVSGLGLTLNCDKSIQKTWCDPNFEREQAVAERIRVDGDLLSSGRAGGSTGAAQFTYLVGDEVVLVEVVSPPGEWTFETGDPQPNESDKGRLTTSDPLYADCRIDSKIVNQPQGSVLTLVVSCRGVG